VKELGDILWYINAVAHLLGSNLEEVAKANNEKLASRKNRGVLSGSGDNR
jgi:NTP pyrophosphatase (non-canonical NTP hydrolase)